MPPCRPAWRPRADPMLSLRHRLGIAHALAKGGVIAYPTEAVWGLGCDPFNPAAVEKLLALKHRPAHKGLILVAADLQQIAPLLVGLSPEQRRQLEDTWPGPVTWLMPDPNHWIPQGVKGRFDTIAVRVSAHPVVQDLCRLWGGPIISTSANRSGEPALRSEWAMRRNRLLTVDYVVPGQTQQRKKPSEIRDLQTGRIIRAG